MARKRAVITWLFILTLLVAFTISMIGLMDEADARSKSGGRSFGSGVFQGLEDRGIA